MKLLVTYDGAPASAAAFSAAWQITELHAGCLRFRAPSDSG